MSAHWSAEAVDVQKLIYSMSFAIDSNGNPHIAYGGDHLYHAYHDGSSWQYETVDNNDPYIGKYVSIDSSDNVHIGYAGIGGYLYFITIKAQIH